jgi:hypothetical protein
VTPGRAVATVGATHGTRTDAERTGRAAAAPQEDP